MIVTFPSRLAVLLQLRMDPRNKDIDLDSLMTASLNKLTEEEMKKQEGDYIYRYRYNGGGASQVWLGSGRYIYYTHKFIYLERLIDRYIQPPLKRGRSP